MQIEDQLLRSIALSCGGDVRKSINTLEIAYLSAPIENNVRTISAQQLQSISQRAALRYDKSDDVHYDLLSALQKSIRGSDENAALHYLARLLEAGDLISPCRRLLVIASEDVGMAYPMCAVIVKACVDSALQLGLPEARIPLAQAVVTMATAPKSNSPTWQSTARWQMSAPERWATFPLPAKQALRRSRGGEQRAVLPISA